MLKVAVESRQAEAMLGQILTRAQRLPIQRLQIIAYRSVMRNFKDQGRPTRWKPLSESTRDSRDSRLRAKKSKGKRRRKKWIGSGAVPGKIDTATGAYMFREYQVLQDTGALKKSIMANSDGKNGFVVYTKLHSEPSKKYPEGYYYPAVQQHGSLDGKIPARPFMVWQSEDIRDIKRIIIAHIRGMQAS